MEHLKCVMEAWCKMFTGSAVEDAKHYMYQCSNDLYVQVPKLYYRKVSERLKNMSISCKRRMFIAVELKQSMLGMEVAEVLMSG